MLKKILYCAVTVSLLVGNSVTANAFEMASKNPKAGQSCAKKELSQHGIETDAM